MRCARAPASPYARRPAERAAVAVRVRPPIKPHAPVATWTPEEKQNRVYSKRGSMIEEYTFDRVFAPDENNQAVFDDMNCRRLVNSVLTGYHETLFAYGQTGSGKTHTIFGADGLDFEEPEVGLLHLMIQALFEGVYHTRAEYVRQIEIACFELMGDTLTDLLADQRSNVPKEDVEHAEIYLKTQLCRYSILTVRDTRVCLDLVEHACARRFTGLSHVNARSSRSHCIVRLRVKSAPRTGAVGCLGELCLVDLAGSEKEWLNPSADGARVARTLNTSLCSLNRLLRRLQCGELEESDRRQGVLNRVLYDHLKEGCGVSMIFCVNMDQEFAPASLSTLHMASGSQLVKNQRKQQFLAVKGEVYALGSTPRRPSASWSPCAGSSPARTESARAPEDFSGLRGSPAADFAEESTAAPPTESESASVCALREQNAELRALVEHNQVAAREKELEGKVLELEAICSGYRQQLELVGAFQMMQALQLSASARSRGEQEEPRLDWAQLLQPPSPTSAASGETPYWVAQAARLRTLLGQSRSVESQTCSVQCSDGLDEPRSTDEGTDGPRSTCGPTDESSSRSVLPEEVAREPSRDPLPEPAHAAESVVIYSPRDAWPARPDDWSPCSAGAGPLATRTFDLSATSLLDFSRAVSEEPRPVKPDLGASPSPVKPIDLGACEQADCPGPLLGRLDRAETRYPVRRRHA